MFHGVWFVLANYPWRVVNEKCVTSMKKTDFPSTVAINVNSSLANYGTQCPLFFIHIRILSGLSLHAVPITMSYFVHLPCCYRKTVSLKLSSLPGSENISVPSPNRILSLWKRDIIQTFHIVTIVAMADLMVLLWSASLRWCHWCTLYFFLALVGLGNVIVRIQSVLVIGKLCRDPFADFSNCTGTSQQE